MLIFFDTEFTELCRDPRLISIGLVSEDGREFYAELSDTYEPFEVGDFARFVVLPLLNGGDRLMPMATLAVRLGSWIETFSQPVELATDSAVWDWPLLKEIFRAPGTWPANLTKKPKLLLFDAETGERFNNAIEQAFAQGLRRHHALDDAKANRAGWLACMGPEVGAPPHEETIFDAKVRCR